MDKNNNKLRVLALIFMGMVIKTVFAKFRNSFYLLCYQLFRGLIRKGTKNVGTLLLQHPIREANLYNAPGGDKDFRNSCCDDRLDGMFCNLFFERRRSSPTEEYKPPASGTLCICNLY